MRSTSCCPLWTKKSLFEVCRSYVQASDIPLEAYIESIDSNDNPDDVARLLQKWGFTLSRPGQPVVSDLQHLLEILDDESYFCGYETVWFLEPSSRQVPTPDFMTWYACECVGELPRSKSPKKTVSWDTVGKWMSDAGALAGASHRGAFQLMVIRGEARDVDSQEWLEKGYYTLESADFSRWCKQRND